MKYEFSLNWNLPALDELVNDIASSNAESAIDQAADYDCPIDAFWFNASDTALELGPGLACVDLAQEVSRRYFVYLAEHYPAELAAYEAAQA